MFDWIKFILLAGILLQNNEDEFVRTAISRYYYGLFGIIRRYLINVKHKYYLMGKNSDVHSEVFNELRFSSDLTEKEVSKIFNKLRICRNQADYDDDYDINHFTDFLKDNEKDLKGAFDSVNYFTNHPNYGGRYDE